MATNCLGPLLTYQTSQAPSVTFVSSSTSDFESQHPNTQAECRLVKSIQLLAYDSKISCFKASGGPRCRLRTLEIFYNGRENHAGQSKTPDTQTLPTTIIYRPSNQQTNVCSCLV